MREHQYQQTAAITSKTREGGARVGVGDYIISPANWEAFYAFLAGMGFFLCLVLCVVWFTERPEGYALFLVAAFAFGLGCSGILGHWRINRQIADYGHVTRYYETEQEEKKPVIHSRPVQAEPARIGGPTGTAVIGQPSAAAVRRLVARALDKTNRQQISVRTCAKYELDYDEVIGELRRVGIMHHDQTVNGSPALTDEGSKALEAWLRGLPYPS